jgi:hypothetical protein
MALTDAGRRGQRPRVRDPTGGRLGRVFRRREGIGGLARGFSRE